MFESLGRLRADERPPYLLLTRSARDGSELLPGARARRTALRHHELRRRPAALPGAAGSLLDRGDAPVLEPARCGGRVARAHGPARRVRRAGTRRPTATATTRATASSLLAGSVAIGPAGDAPARRRRPADPGRRVLPRAHARGARPRDRAADALVDRRARPARRRTRSRARSQIPEAGLVISAGGAAGAARARSRTRRAGTSTCFGCRRRPSATAPRASRCAAATRRSSTGSTSSPVVAPRGSAACRPRRQPRRQRCACDSRGSVPAARRITPAGSYPAAMIRVYAATDCRARAITFGDETPEPPLELVRTFDPDEREAAWELLHALGRLWVHGRPSRSADQP